VFEADEQTARQLASRTGPGGPGGLAGKHTADALYFRADAGAKYAFSCTIDLGDIVPQVGAYSMTLGRYTYNYRKVYL
jgi:hypothetical protein